MGHDDGGDVGDGVGGVGEQDGGGGEMHPWPASGDAGSFHQIVDHSLVLDALLAKLYK